MRTFTTCPYCGVKIGGEHRPNCRKVGLNTITTCECGVNIGEEHLPFCHVGADMFTTCPECGVNIGEEHLPYCDGVGPNTITTCPECGVNVGEEHLLYCKLRMYTSTICPDCGVNIGELHMPDCDVEVCPDCGREWFTCGCKGDIIMPLIPWDGTRPGVKECREFGWYTKEVYGQGKVQCGKDDVRGELDLGRLHTDAVWDREKGRFVLPK